MILIFDLDDTLYPEIDFVRGGLKNVSNYLSTNYDLNSDKLYNQMLNLLNLNGRGKIFDDILKNYKIYSKKNVLKCISVYRSSKTSIKLYPEAKKCLNHFSDHRKYLITDGNVNVQRNKIKQLNLNQHFIKTIPTNQYGKSFSKPSTKCFEKIIKIEKCNPNEIIYIGDNPNKDFINIKKIGIRTLRVLTGSFKDLSLSHDYEAEHKINNLSYFTKNLIKTIYENR